MKNFIANGNTLQLTAPDGGVIGGQLFKQGSIVGVIVADASEGELFTIQIYGAFSDMPKSPSETWTIGDTLYLKPDASMLTKTVTGNTFAGYAYADAQTADTVGSVLLSH